MSDSSPSGAVVYVIPAYPPLGSQPFVVNEMVELMRAGRPLVVLPLYAGAAETVRHDTFAALVPTRVLPARLVDASTLALAVLALLRWPGRVLRALAGLHWAAGWNPWAHARVLAVTPKALAAAWRLRGGGVRHVHAHFALQTADCAALLARALGAPFSFTAHAYDIYATTLRLRNDTLAWKVRAAACVVTVSDFGAAWLRRFLPPGEGARVRTIRVGIPLELFRPAPLPEPAAPLELVCVARWCEKKGLDTLLEACGLLRDRGVRFRLRLYGDGPLRPVLTERWTALGLAGRVELGGPLAQEEVAARLRESHAFVMPCRRDASGDMDGIPTVFMEAMATGRPVVSTAISGIPELVRHEETGLVVPPDDPAAVAGAIERLAREPALVRRLGEAGRALVVREHDQVVTARRMLEVVGEGRR